VKLDALAPDLLRFRDWGQRLAFLNSVSEDHQHALDILSAPRAEQNLATGNQSAIDPSPW
jgi:hypothetical protein